MYLKRLTPHEVEEFDWFCRARRGQTTEPAPTWGMDLMTAARRFDSARYRALERVWEHEGKWGLSSFQTDSLLEKFRQKRGALRFVQIPHQYLQLTPLIGARVNTSTDAKRADNPATVLVKPAAARRFGV